MITVHHLENSRSQRVLWLLEELGLAYTVKRYARDPDTMLAPRELRAVHPLGKSPIVEADGQVIAETGAIVQFLTARAGGALVPPPDTPEALRYTWAESARQFYDNIATAHALGPMQRPDRRPSADALPRPS